jgi:hypothetical protein
MAFGARSWMICCTRVSRGGYAVGRRVVRVVMAGGVLLRSVRVEVVSRVGEALRLGGARVEGRGQLARLVGVGLGHQLARGGRPGRYGVRVGEGRGPHRHARRGGGEGGRRLPGRCTGHHGLHRPGTGLPAGTTGLPAGTTGLSTGTAGLPTRTANLPTVPAGVPTGTAGLRTGILTGGVPRPHLMNPSWSDLVTLGLGMVRCRPWLVASGVGWGRPWLVGVGCGVVGSCPGLAGLGSGVVWR